MMIVLRGVPGGTKTARQRVACAIDGTTCTLLVGDSHAAWHSHQDAATLPDFERLFARLADQPGAPLTVERVDVLPGRLRPSRACEPDALILIRFGGSGPQSRMCGRAFSNCLPRSKAPHARAMWVR